MGLSKLLLLFAPFFFIVDAKLIDLTADTFDKTVLESGKNTFVKFYAPVLFLILFSFFYLFLRMVFWDDFLFV